MKSSGLSSSWFSQPVTDFRGRWLHEPAYPAGYAALIERYDLAVPSPPRLAGIALRHHPDVYADWLLLTPRHRPSDSLQGHLSFALRYEGVDLAVLAALFKTISGTDVAAIVRARPTSAYARRIWFLYEWLVGKALDVEDAGKVRAVEVADPQRQITLRKGTTSPRHRVINNLPGTSAFCPMVRRTARINAFLDEHLDRRACEVVGRTRPDIIARAAAFLLLADSKSSFAIENERPSTERAVRWGQAIAQAGNHALSIAEFERLQRVVIGDARFVRLGLRTEGGFIGVHDRDTQTPIPEHISARWDDLHDLIEGLIAYTERADGDIDAVIAAAVIAFGFVYIHPFEDGNGRIHRWLIHHVLARANYNPPGLVFPVSAAILRNVADYQQVLESYSRLLLPFIEWRETEQHNVEVLSKTTDYYRFFDATAHVEFLYSCVQQTVNADLPNEVAFLEAFDRFSADVQHIVDMPAGSIELLHTFLRQGDGTLSGRARSREFAQFTDDEAAKIQELYQQHLGALDRPAAIVSRTSTGE
jgi:hypothetical protein